MYPFLSSFVFVFVNSMTLLFLPDSGNDLSRPPSRPVEVDHDLIDLAAPLDPRQAVSIDQTVQTDNTSTSFDNKLKRVRSDIIFLAERQARLDRKTRNKSDQINCQCVILCLVSIVLMIITIILVLIILHFI